MIRLWQHVSDTLALCEGIETALSVAHMQRPVWASVDASNMAALPVLDVAALHVFADRDSHGAGEKAAWQAVRRWKAAGREARVFIPDVFGDFNDVMRS